MKGSMMSPLSLAFKKTPWNITNHLLVLKEAESLQDLEDSLKNKITVHSMSA